MNTIKINVREGVFEIAGENEEWVWQVQQETLEKFLDTVRSRLRSEESSQRLQALSPIDVDLTARVAKVKKTGGKKISQYKSYRNPDLEARLTPEVQEKLRQFVEDRKAAFDNSQPGQAVIIAFFLKEELQWDGVDKNDMYTIYSIMGWHIPSNIPAQMINATMRNRYFSGITEGKYRLSNKGENFARIDSKGGEKI